MSKVMPALDMRTYSQLHQDRGLDWKESYMPCMSTFIVYILKPILDIDRHDGSKQTIVRLFT